jgi:hypothetical protein
MFRIYLYSWFCAARELTLKLLLLQLHGAYIQHIALTAHRTAAPFVQAAAAEAAAQLESTLQQLASQQQGVTAAHSQVEAAAAAAAAAFEEEKVQFRNQLAAWQTEELNRRTQQMQVSQTCTLLTAD